MASPACVDFGDLGDPAISSSSHEIVNGVTNSGDQAVVALMQGTHQFCTGTLVSPRIVATAAHCIYPNLDVPLEDMRVFFGPRIDGPGEYRRVVDGVAHPEWDEARLPYDVAVVALADDAPVAPIPLAETLSGLDLSGARARMVGYGITEVDGDGNGIKREGEMIIDRLNDNTIFLKPGPAATCHGDSGGPLFLIDGQGREVFAGIHSRSNCKDGSLNERVDVHVREFIVPFAEEIGDPLMGAGVRSGATCGPDSDCPDEGGLAGCSAAGPDGSSQLGTMALFGMLLLGAAAVRRRRF